MANYSPQLVSKGIAAGGFILGLIAAAAVISYFGMSFGMILAPVGALLCVAALILGSVRGITAGGIILALVGLVINGYIIHLLFLVSRTGL
jgi:hypothetical protein